MAHLNIQHYLPFGLASPLSSRCSDKMYCSFSPPIVATLILNAAPRHISHVVQPFLLDLSCFASRKMKIPVFLEKCCSSKSAERGVLFDARREHYYLLEQGHQHGWVSLSNSSPKARWHFCWRIRVLAVLYIKLSNHRQILGLSNPFWLTNWYTHRPLIRVTSLLRNTRSMDA